MSWSCCCDKHRPSSACTFVPFGGPLGRRSWGGGTGPGQGEAPGGWEGFNWTAGAMGSSLSERGPCAPECLITLEMGTQQAARPLPGRGAGLGEWAARVAAQWVRLDGGQRRLSPFTLLACHPGVSDPTEVCALGTLPRRAGPPGAFLAKCGRSDTHAPHTVMLLLVDSPGLRVKDTGWAGVSAAQLTLCFSL